MFGYIKPYRPDLTLLEDARYKAAYCGICAALGSKGALCRALLRFDITFFAILRSALEQEEVQPQPLFCPAKLKKLPALRNDISELCAQLHLLLTYEKLRDDLRDADGLQKSAAKAALKAIAPLYAKAAQAHPTLAKALDEMDAAQCSLEKKGCLDPEEVAEPFSAFCETLFAYRANEQDAPALAWMGRNMGRWIVLMDALDDFNKDKAANVYNVFVLQGLTREQAAAQLSPMLDMLRAQAFDAFALLTPLRDQGILRNILTQGMNQEALRVLAGKPEQAKEQGISLV